MSDVHADSWRDCAVVVGKNTVRYTGHALFMCKWDALSVGWEVVVLMVLR